MEESPTLSVKERLAQFERNNSQTTKSSQIIKPIVIDNSFNEAINDSIKNVEGPSVPIPISIPAAPPLPMRKPTLPDSSTIPALPERTSFPPQLPKRLNSISFPPKPLVIAPPRVKVQRPSQSIQQRTKRPRPINPRAKKRYEALFDVLKEQRVEPEPAWAQRREALSASVIEQVWNRSRLSREWLSLVWNLCDTTKTGKLSKDDFSRGMWMIDEELRRNMKSKDELLI